MVAVVFFAKYNNGDMPNLAIKCPIPVRSQSNEVDFMETIALIPICHQQWIKIIASAAHGAY